MRQAGLKAPSVEEASTALLALSRAEWEAVLQAVLADGVVPNERRLLSMPALVRLALADWLKSLLPFPLVLVVLAAFDTEWQTFAKQFERESDSDGLRTPSHLLVADGRWWFVSPYLRHGSYTFFDTQSGTWLRQPELLHQPLAVMTLDLNVLLLRFSDRIEDNRTEPTQGAANASPHAGESDGAAAPSAA